MTVSARYTVDVPRGQRQVFVWVSEIDDDTFAALSASLDEPEPTESLGELRKRVSRQLLDHPNIDPELLLAAFLGASGARTWQNASSEDVAKAIVASPDLGVELEHQNSLVARISTLLDSRSLSILAKGLDVLTEHDRLYLKARMVTDVRPVYQAEDVSEPAALVFVHTLRLDFKESGRTKSLYVALDESDLEQLRRILDREANKMNGLKRTVQLTGLQLLDFDEDPTEDVAE